jgi:tRNA(fMet)-specific endonuclease VapC
VYCLDTDMLVAVLRSDPPLHLVRRLARTPAAEQCTTSVTLGEIAYAAARNGDAELISRLGRLVAAASRVLAFDAQAAEAYGSLRAHLETLGTRLDEPSLRIASIAVAHDLTLVTGNARLYDRVPGLRIENWLEPDEVELERRDEEVEEPAAAAAVPPAEGAVRHPGLVPSLEERARTAASGGDRASG